MSNNPFDFTKAFEQFDPKQMAEKIQETFKVDFEAIQSAQDKNMELLMATNKAIADNSKALLERQAAMLQTAMTEATEAAKALASTDNPQDIATKQAELVQAAYEKAVANSTEISEMAKKTQEEVATKVQARIEESMAEFKASLAKIS